MEPVVVWDEVGMGGIETHGTDICAAALLQATKVCKAAWSRCSQSVSQCRSVRCVAWSRCKDGSRRFVMQPILHPHSTGSTTTGCRRFVCPTSLHTSLPAVHDHPGTPRHIQPRKP